MDDYKASLISLIQDLPLLWDPSHKDYKNKDQRTQVWERLDSTLPPPRKGVSAKETWLALNRSYCNALNRKKKKSGSGVSADDKPWKFEEAMRYLLVVKQKRNRSGNMTTLDDGDSSDSCDIEEIPGPESPSTIQQTMDESDIVADERHQQDHDSMTKKKETSSRNRMHKRQKGDDGEEQEKGLMGALQKRLDEKDKSPRFWFFKSIMPQVESMTNDEFLDFQVDVLGLLKKISLSNQSFQSSITHEGTSRSNTPHSYQSSVAPEIPSRPNTPQLYPPDLHQDANNRSNTLSPWSNDPYGPSEVSNIPPGCIANTNTPSSWQMYEHGDFHPFTYDYYAKKDYNQ